MKEKAAWVIPIPTDPGWAQRDMVESAPMEVAKTVQAREVPQVRTLLK
jgi:hypothetical protein